MSHSPSDAGIQYENEHGTVRSYVIGFLLSLILTFIPYYLVVNQTVTGQLLLVTILSFAFLQLIVQVVFFLHLGRGPKPNWNLYFFISTVGIMLVVVGGSIFIINNLVYNMLPSDQAKKLIEGQGIYQIEGQETGACHGQYENHKVTIKDGQVSPIATYASKCDTLIFINEAGATLDVVFGVYPDREVYAGENGLTVTTRRTDSVVLSEVGEYQFYIDGHPETAGFFTVTAE